MKRLLISLLCLFIGCMVISCGSTDVTDPSVVEDEIKQETEQKEEEQIPEPVKIARFDDWEYKGFGNDLPEWVEAAVDLDYDALAKAFPDKELLVVKGFGSNTDMCESASYADSPYPEEAEFITALWVRVNSEYEKLDKPYISIRVFAKYPEPVFSDEFDDVEYVGE